MRLATLTIFATLVAGPAFAQQVSPMTGTTTGTPSMTPAAPATAAPATSAAPTSARSGHRHRRTMQERFDEANTTHDGKLTLDQAKAGKLNRIAQHFDAMDTAKKGYVTMDDVHAYNRAQRAAHKAAAAPK